jgi:mitochondrial fission protein ELM1
MDAIVVSDGKKGHVNQSLAFAELLGAHDTSVHTIKKNSLTPDFIMRLLSCLLSPRSYPSPWRKRAVKHYFGDMPIAATPTADTLIISAGTLTAVPALLLAAEYRARGMHILMPSFVPFRSFDAVVLPQHDIAGKPPRNVIALPIALGPVGGRSLEDSLAEMNRRLSPAGAPLGECMAVLIGGESAHYHMAQDALLSRLGKLIEFAKASSLRLLLTTSRRTPAAIEDGIKVLAQASPGAFALCVWGRTDAYNPIPAFLEIARSVVVTEESVSMVSESILGGHCPFILPLERRDQVPKFPRFYKYLYGHGLAQQFPSKDMGALLQSPRRNREEVATSIDLPQALKRLRELLKLPVNS